MDDEIVRIAEGVSEQWLSDDDQILQHGKNELFIKIEDDESLCVFASPLLPEASSFNEIEYREIDRLSTGTHCAETVEKNSLDDELVSQHEGGTYYHTRAFMAFGLSDVPWLREEYERVRDQIRHDADRPRETDTNTDALQEIIDVLVTVERAVQYVRTTGSKRRQHYRRLSALCDEPQEVIKNVERVVEQQPEPARIFGKLKNVVG